MSAICTVSPRPPRQTSFFRLGRKISSVAPEALELLYAALKEEVSTALLYGKPGCGKSTLALKFAWQTQGAFDAQIFQLWVSVPLPRSQSSWRQSSSLGLRPIRPRSKLPPPTHGLPSGGHCTQQYFMGAITYECDSALTL